MRDIMISQGFSEVINYSFYAPSLLRDLNIQDHDPRGNPVSLLNPLSSSQSVLRTTLLPSLLVNLNVNLNNKVTLVKLFEIASIFLRTQESAQPLELRRIAGLIAGLRHGQHWGLAHEAVDFFDIKGSVEFLLDGLRINSYRLVPGSNEPYLHPILSQALYIHDEPAGSFGEVHPDILERFDIESAAYVFEFDFDLIARHYAASQKYEQFSRFPAIFRDISLIVDESLAYDTIRSSIKAFQNPLITDCFVFDCYRGRHIPPGKKGIALRVKFQSAERTLTDVEVNRIHDKLLDHVAHGTGAELRQA
jgi:phenylalanyl-tRNA synthetase beta chain